MSTKWFPGQRQAFIKETLDKHGKINRADIVDRFGVGLSIASRDLNCFMRVNPGVMEYDLSNRVYRKVTK